MTIIVYIAIGIAFLIPLGFLYGVRQLDLYDTGQFWLNMLTIVCGLLAYLLAAQINPWFVRAGIADNVQVARIVAPIVEEILKSLILIYLVSRADFNYVVDGVIYGYGAGIGFAIIENYEYIVGYSDIAMTVALARVFSTNLVHATGSAIIGGALANQRGGSSRTTWFLIFLGYAFSIGFHMLFNTVVGLGVALFVAIIFGAAGSGLIYYIIQRGMKVQKQWVQEQLGESSSRITQNEVKALSQIEKINKLLKPVAEQFGDKKADMVKEMFSLQAEMGIKMRLVSSASNEGMKREIEDIVKDMQAKVDLLRRDIGSRCMFFVRTVYVDVDVKVFDTIQSRIVESSTGQKGGGLWDTTTVRIRSSKVNQNPDENNS
jgi:RsiW-degrading membrane proteinase PrsW (M82 family)